MDKQQLSKAIEQQIWLLQHADIDYACYFEKIDKQDFFIKYVWNKLGIPAERMEDCSKDIEIKTFDKPNNSRNIKRLVRYCNW